MCCKTRGVVTVRKEEPKKAAARTLGGQQKHAVPTKCIAGSISKKRQRTKIKKSMKKTLQLLPHKIYRIKKHYTNKLNYLEETVNF